MKNENTPTKSTPNKENSVSATPHSLKVKTRLNFDSGIETKMVLNFDSSPKTKGSKDNVNFFQAGCSKLEISPLKSEFFEDNWDVTISEVSYGTLTKTLFMNF